MALDFGAQTDERYVTYTDLGGSNLLSGTVWAWIFPRDVGNQDSVWLLKSPSDIDTSFYFGSPGFDTRVWQVARTRAGALCQGTAASDGPIANNEWAFVAGTWDTGGVAGDQRLFHGTLTKLVTELPSYDTQTAGSSSVDDITGDTLYSGDMPLAPAQFEHGYDGIIACFGIIDGVLLTEAQLRAIQFRRGNNFTTQHLIYSELGYNGIGTQADWSGNAHNGTVTAAVVSDHVALPPAFGFNHEQGLLNRSSVTKVLASDLTMVVNV